MGYLQYMMPNEIKGAIEQNWPLIIVSGSIELHGNHLPVGTDLIIAEEIMKLVEQQTNIIIAPSIVYGPTGYAVGGPETCTVDVGVENFKRHVKDVLVSFYKMGFRKIIIIQHHQGVDGPSGLAFKMAAAEIFHEYNQTLGNSWWTNRYHNLAEISFHVEVLPALLKSEAWLPSHGALGETEPMLALKPEYVKLKELKINDFPWNWDRGNEADRSNLTRGHEKINEIVQNWIHYLNSITENQDKE